MPYDRISELPDSVRDNVPKHAQEIYKEAFNSAWDEYKDADDSRGDASREETAHKVAWSAVKEKYERGGDDRWHEKSPARTCTCRSGFRTEERRVGTEGVSQGRVRGA